MAESVEVAPLVGAWIEIVPVFPLYYPFKSLLSWERGLKLTRKCKGGIKIMVAPLVGAWIEIRLS